MKNANVFCFPANANPQAVLDRISNTFRFRRERKTRTRPVFYDTFDWRLHQNHWSLSKEDGMLQLRRIENDAAVASEVWPFRAHPKFWRDVRDGRLRKRLESCLDIRALIPVAAVDITTRSIRILNEDLKPVMRVFFEEIRAIGREEEAFPVNRIILQPLRECDQELKEFRKWLDSLKFHNDSRDRLTVFLDSRKRKAGDYSSKISFSLQPDMPSGRAVIGILHNLLRIIRKNEEGIQSDIDTEFLHDYRVSVRRTRSALSQIKDVFLPDMTAHWKKAFTDLGKMTNRLRDLDVFLLKQDSYKLLVPEELRPIFEILSAGIRAERNGEHRKFVRFLKSDPYQTLIASWEQFLNEAGRNQEDENANDPILETARDRILSRYKKVIRLGRKIKGTASNTQLHRLRIECKKLRYLLEFFSSLFSENQTFHLIGQLKKLQDSLGNYNDTTVQQRLLSQFLEDNHPKYAQGRKTAAVIGGLMAHLYHEQHQLHTTFNRTFNSFARHENRRRIHRLLGTASQPMR